MVPLESPSGKCTRLPSPHGTQPSRSDIDRTCPLQNDSAANASTNTSGPAPASHYPVDASPSDLPDNLTALSRSFPLTSTAPALALIDLQELMEEYLPPWPRAQQLCALYLEQAPWFFGAVTERQLNEEVLPLFYEEAADEVRARIHMGATAGSSGPGKLGNSAEAFHLPTANTQPTAHDLALIFVVFCFGALTDPTLPPAPHNVEATRYYQLTRASLSLEPVLDRSPSMTTVQTLSLMGIYQVRTLNLYVLRY